MDLSLQSLEVSRRTSENLLLTTCGTGEVGWRVAAVEGLTVVAERFPT